MTYNRTPDIIRFIKGLASRVDRLERNKPQASLYPIPGYNATTWQAGGYDYTTSNTVFETAFYVPFLVTAPTPVAVFEAVCSDSSTSAEVRLASDSVTSLTGANGSVIPPIAIPVNTTSLTLFSTDQDPNYWDGLPMGTKRFIELQVRRTAGAGTVTMRLHYLYQKAS